MIKNSRKTGLVVVFPAIVAVFRGSECDSANAQKETTEHQHPLSYVSKVQKASLEEIQIAILLSLTTGDWVITAQTEGSISAKIWSDGDTTSISITYDTESISIEDRSTDNIGESRTPVREIQNLMNDIQRNLLAGVSL